MNCSSPSPFVTAIDRPEFPVGFVPLGRGRERLLPLRLEATLDHPFSGRAGNDGAVVHGTECVVDVAGQHRGDGRGLVVAEKWLLSGANGRLTLLVFGLNFRPLGRGQNLIPCPPPMFGEFSHVDHP